MKICLLEDSLPFDGLTPDQRPLGGFQRAVAGLAAALARRRHDVTVINHADAERWVDGVRWLPFGEALTTSYDLLIACGKPSLLDGMNGRVLASRRVLWSVADPATLLEGDNAQALRERNADLWFIGSMQAGRYQGRQPAQVVLPGVASVYRPADVERLPPPVAIVTASPDYRLESLIRLWLEKVAPVVPGAELHIYSSLLSRPLRAAGPVPEAQQALYELIVANEGLGLKIKAPLPDRGMALVYQQARVHLHPGHADDFAVWTLYDSHACGLPAVARMVGGTMDCVTNGQTGYLVPDDEAVVNVAAQILSDASLYNRMSEAAGSLARRRSWDVVALDVELLWGESVPEAPAVTEAPAAVIAAAVAPLSAVDLALAADDDLNDPANTLPGDPPDSQADADDRQG